MKRQTFTDLQKRLVTRKKLRMFIREFAEFYANSDYGISKPYLTKYYNVTDSCYRKLLELAVIWGVVDDATVDKMEEKTCYNASLHSGSSRRTEEKYARLREERAEYKKFPFTEREAIKIAVQFIEKRISKQTLADEYCVKKRDIDNALYVSSAYNWINDKLFEKLKNRSLENNNNPETIKFFEDLEKLRNENK